MMKAHDVPQVPRREGGTSNAGLLWVVCRFLRVIALVLIDIREGRRQLDICPPEPNKGKP